MPPFGAVKAGDRVWNKQTSGPVRVEGAMPGRPDAEPSRVEQLRRDCNALIRGGAAFWRAKRGSRFATLIWLEDARPVERAPDIPRSRGTAWYIPPHARASR